MMPEQDNLMRLQQFMGLYFDKLEAKSDRVEEKVDKLALQVEHRLTKMETLSAARGAIAGAIVALALNLLPEILRLLRGAP